MVNLIPKWTSNWPSNVLYSKSICPIGLICNLTNNALHDACTTRLSYQIQDYYEVPAFVAVKSRENNTTTKMVVSVERVLVQDSKYYLTTSAQNVRERPKDRLEIVKANIPSNSIGFLPTWSDMRLQNMTVVRDVSWRIASWNKKSRSRTLTGPDPTDGPSNQRNIQPSFHLHLLQK